MKTVLLIDDDEDEFLIFSEVLEISALPLTCIYLSDPAAAIAWLGSNRADFIFIDMVMPKLNGIELLQEIKTLSKTDDIKFVILSTLINDKLFEKAIAAGATTCIQKSDTVKGMSETMKKFFAAYQL